MRLLDYAAKCGKVTHACQVFGVSRKTYHEWVKATSEYATSPLLAKDRRAPHEPIEMSAEKVSAILVDTVPRPSLGREWLLRDFADRGVHRSASGVAEVEFRPIYMTSSPFMQPATPRNEVSTHLKESHRNQSSRQVSS